MNRHKWISLFIIFSIINGESDDSILGYFTESSSKILSDKSNQLILGSAAIAALAATKVDRQVKSYAQTKGLLSDDISHFGDMYGGQMIKKRISFTEGTMYDFDDVEILKAKVRAKLCDDMADEANICFKYATKLFEELNN